MNESHATKHWSQLTNIIRYDCFFFYLRQHASTLIRTIWIFNALFFLALLPSIYNSFNVPEKLLLEKYWFVLWMNVSWAVGSININHVNAWRWCWHCVMAWIFDKDDGAPSECDNFSSRKEKLTRTNRLEQMETGWVWSNTNIILNFSIFATICVLNMNRLPFISFWYADLQKRHHIQCYDLSLVTLLLFVAFCCLFYHVAWIILSFARYFSLVIWWATLLLKSMHLLNADTSPYEMYWMEFYNCPCCYYHRTFRHVQHKQRQRQQ